MTGSCDLKILNDRDLTPDLLDRFDRYQETDFVWFVDEGQLSQKSDRFIDQWDNERKAQVIESLASVCRTGGIIAGAFIDGALIGFTCVDSRVFGGNREYVELEYMHVSNGYRNAGIGKALFRLTCEAVASRLKAKKLYISAHPSVETQGFYRACGCVPAVEIDAGIYAREPLDIQMEYVL